VRSRRYIPLFGLALLCLAADEIPAPPAIQPGGIVNAASHLPATLPGAGVARNARFSIPGVRLGPTVAARGSETDPPTKLAEVSVQFRQGDLAIPAGLLLVSARRIEAWAPPTIPLGRVQLTVTYQGRASEPYDLIISANAPGLYLPETPPSLFPGDPLELSATGLSEPPARLLVGGKPASGITVEPAACCRGNQRIVFRIPADAPSGCFVPVQAVTGDGRSTNSIPVAIHPPGQPCPDDVDWFRESVEHAPRAGYFVLARIAIAIEIAHKGERYQFDYGVSSFGRQESGRRIFPPLPPLHTCAFFADRINLRQYLGLARSPGEWTSVPEKIPGNRGLGAGASLSISGPAGARQLNRDPHQPEYYNAILGGTVPFSHDPATPLYLRNGRYRIESPGGSDVGPFAAALDVTGPLVWRNLEAIDEIDRARGVTVEWKAARRDDAVLIAAANSDRASGDSAMCLCLAPAADGRFTIPPYALANIPKTIGEGDLAPSFLLLVEMPVKAPARIQAHGIDSAFAAFVSVSARLARFR
jgi:hypothetical protein